MKNKEVELQKIRKLINSGVFEDRYIGIKLLDNLPKGTAVWALRRLGAIHNKGELTTWLYNKGPELALPKEYDDQYILGKNYAYNIYEYGFMADNKGAFNRTTKSFERDKDFKVIENWREQ